MPDTIAATLDESVKNALDEVKPPDAEVDGEQVEAPPADEPKIEDKPKDDDKLGLSDQEQIEARQLFAALKDPDKAGQVIQFLATQAGYAKIETKKDAVEVKKDITDVLKESLGPDLEYLAEKLGPAIDKLVGEKLTENTKDIRATLEAQKDEAIAKESSDAMKGLAREFYKKDELPDDIALKMSKVMEDMPPSGRLSVGDYLRNVFTLATGGQVRPQTSERLERNRTDAPSRLASEGTRQVVTGSEGDKKMNLNDAVADAINKVSGQIEKG